MRRIKKLFSTPSLKVIPFITAGYPGKKDTLDIVLAADSAGAAMIELGMPFSDPLADGPIIQQSSQVAIENGVNINWILETVEKVRLKSEIPIALMGYINPIIKYGLIKFIRECARVGVDGLILPDVPPEEAKEYVMLAKQNNISPILLVAPNTSNIRISEISEMACDLIYCVSIMGITGSRSRASNIEVYLKRVEKYSKCPFVVGFGINNRSDVIHINKLSHGAVIGSAIIQAVRDGGDPSVVVSNYIKGLLE